MENKLTPGQCWYHYPGVKRKHSKGTQTCYGVRRRAEYRPFCLLCQFNLRRNHNKQNLEKMMENLQIGRSFLILSLVLTLTGISQSIYNGVGHIPTASQVDWTNAGLYDPISGADNILYITDFTGSDDDDKIQAAIAAAQSNPTDITIIYFPAGQYVFQQTINLSSNIIIQGEGSETTFFKFDNDKCSQGFSIVGGDPINEKIITADIAKTDKVITVSNTTGYQVNNWIQFLEKTNPDAKKTGTNKYAPCGQISRIIDLDPIATSITIKDEASKAYDTDYDLFLYKITPIENVGIENLSVERLPDGDGKGKGVTINFKYAVNCWVRGVETKDAFGRHINIYASSHIEISGCFIHHAHDYCSGESCGGEKDGFGYGLTLTTTSTNCLIENNVFQKLRHAMLTADGANCNVFTYNYSREQYLEGPGILGCLGGELHGDICLHSQYSYANLFEQNWIEFIQADDVHGNNGPYNAFVRNVIKDHNDHWHNLELLNAPNTAVLGNVTTLDYSVTMPLVTNASTSFSTDIFGIRVPTGQPYESGEIFHHNDLAVPGGYIIREECTLLDISYYYDDIPYFASFPQYSFPALGPPLLLTTYSIPAKDRFSSTPKTYIHPSKLTKHPVMVNVEQRNSSGSLFGSIDHWEGAWQNYPIPIPPADPLEFQLRFGSTHAFRADQNLNSGEKFRLWETNIDEHYLNHNAFIVDENLSEIVAKHYPAVDGTVTIRTDVGAEIEFADPWLIDYTDPDYGNSLRNRGMEQTGPGALMFKRRPSPFNPDFTTSFNGDVYQGVFLNQSGPPFWNPPYYSVRGVDNQPFTINGKTITWDWESWSYDPAKIALQSPNSKTTAVVFKTASATVTANLKGRRASDTPEATAGNNSRKIVTHPVSGSLHLYQVYVDRGQVYFTESTDNGATWSKDVRLDRSDQYECLNPAIGVDKYGIVHVVYVQNEAGFYTVHYTWLDSEGDWQDPENISGYYKIGYGVPTTPAIHVIYNWSVYVVWNSTHPLDQGIWLRYKENYWSNWSDYYKAVDTDDGDVTPAVSYGNLGTMPDYDTHLVWRNEDTDEIIYLNGDYDYGSGQWLWGSAANLDVPGLIDNQFPSLDQKSVGNLQNLYVVWQAMDNSVPEEKTNSALFPRKESLGCPPASPSVPVVCFRENSGSWQTLHIFATGSTCDRFPVITNWESGSGQDVAIAYRYGENAVRYLLRQNGFWSSARTLTSDGANPALTTANDIPHIVWTEFNASPYRVQHSRISLIPDESIAGLTDPEQAGPPHSRRIYFKLREALTGGHQLPIDGDIIFEIADPQWQTSAGSQPLKPLHRDSLLTPGNAFLFNPIHISEPGERLVVPVKIVGRDLKRVSPTGDNPFPLPLLRLRLKDGNTGQVLNTVHTFQSTVLGNDSTRYIAIADTFEIELSTLVNRHIQVEGATFFNPNKPGKGRPQIAEVYDLREESLQPRLAGKVPAAINLEVPKQFSLSQNYPNPFNPTTTIEFQLPERTSVNLKIYDIQGRLVKTLLKEEMEAGIHQILWDGRDEAGNAAASGVYLYHFRAGNFNDTGKMVLMR